MGNFRGRKLLWIFEVWEPSAKVFSAKLGGVPHPPMIGTWFQAIRESFLREILTSYRSAKVFSLKSLPLYGRNSGFTLKLHPPYTTTGRSMQLALKTDLVFCRKLSKKSPSKHYSTRGSRIASKNICHPPFKSGIESWCILCMCVCHKVDMATYMWGCTPPAPTSNYTSVLRNSPSANL